MSSSLILLIFLSLCIGVGAWLIFLWAVQQGEFDDPEGPKYRMLDDDGDYPAGPPRDTEDKEKEE